MAFSDPIKKRQAEDFRDTKDLALNNSWKIFKIMAEFVEGYDVLAKYKNEVTVFGSARTDPNDYFYQQALKLGQLLGQHDFTTITGGGPGIMEAANKGAFEIGGKSLGLGIQLPNEQSINPFVTQAVNFSYFFTRKVMLTAPSQAYVYFPGGFGTLDELFQVLNETSIGFTQKVPVILVGKDFWAPLIEFLHTKCVDEVQSIKPEYLDQIHIVDTAEEAFEIIRHTEDYPNLADLQPGNIPTGTGGGVNWRIFRIMAEFVEGLDFQAALTKNVTVLGTNKIPQKHRYYEAAYEIAKALADKDYTVVTGGGYGIAEAANKGSRDADKTAYAMVQHLSHNRSINEFVQNYITFDFPFTRQVILTGPSNSYVFCPGGLGTLHQLFEVLTLVQTEKVQTSPLILFDEEFWAPLVEYIENVLDKEFRTISPEDVDLFAVSVREDEVVQIIETAFANHPEALQ